MSQYLENLISSQEDSEEKEKLEQELKQFKEMLEKEKQLKLKKIITISVEELMKWSDKSNSLKKEITAINTEKASLHKIIDSFDQKQQIELESYEAKIQQLQKMLDDNQAKSSKYFNQTVESQNYNEQIKKEIQESKVELNSLRDQNKEVFTQQQKLVEKDNQIQDLQQQIKQLNQFSEQNKNILEKNKELEKQIQQFEIKSQEQNDFQTESKIKINQLQQKYNFSETKIFQKEEYIAQLNEINRLQKKNEETLREDIKYHQSNLEESQGEINVLQKKYTNDVKELKNQLQKEKENSLFILEEKQKHERDLQNIMQKRKQNSGRVDEREKVILETMSNQIQEYQQEIGRYNKKIGCLQQEVSGLTDKIEMKNKIIKEIIQELYKAKPLLSESLEKDIDNDDYIYIETTKNLKNTMQQYEIVEKCLLENLRLKQELQKLCHEINNHYNEEK